MKLSTELWDTISLYVCERDGWRCYFAGKIAHNCGGPMQACHVIPKGRSRLGARLYDDEKDIVCGCRNINWWMSAHANNQQTAEIAVERYDPERWDYLQGVKSQIALSGGSVRKAGMQKVLLADYRAKLRALMDKRKWYPVEELSPSNGTGYITYLADGTYCRNTWNGKRWRLQNDIVMEWSEIE